MQNTVESDVEDVNLHSTYIQTFCIDWPIDSSKLDARRNGMLRT